LHRGCGREDKTRMSRKHGELRMLCSEMVTLHWQPKSGASRKLTANLEQIWTWGACLQTDTRISRLSRLWFVCGDYEFRGRVVALGFLKDLGYFLDVRFDRGCRWSELKHRPQHFLNPLVLLAHRVLGATLSPQIAAPISFQLPPGFPNSSRRCVSQTAG
jgi:hypothetical protein